MAMPGRAIAVQLAGQHDCARQWFSEPLEARGQRYRICYIS
jgi:hypothetical protein